MDINQAISATEQLILESPIVMSVPHPVYDDRAYWRTHKERFRRTAMLFHQHTEERTVQVLDFGSQFLHFASMLHELGYETHGCDVAEFAMLPALQKRADQLRIRNLPIDSLIELRQLPYATHQFDVVFLLETLEHFNANPILLLQEIHRILRPGGRLVITTPNYYCYQKLGRRIARFIKGEGGYMSVQELVGQVNFTHHWKEYSRRELRELLSTLDYREVCCENLTGVGGRIPGFIYFLCRPWGLFMYAEYVKEGKPSSRAWEPPET